MIEFVVVLGMAVLAWLIWQLHTAKKFTKFKRYIDTELRPTVLQAITDDLLENSSAAYPNNTAHQEATLYYWGKYKVRILQAALSQELITHEWLIKTGNMRNCQHLFHIEQAHAASAPVEKITMNDASKKCSD